MEKDPWWRHVPNPLLTWKGPIGVKADGGGCTRGQGKVGSMKIWRAVCAKNKEAIVQLVDDGEDVNEVDASGSTPLHICAFTGWVEGAELLLALGAHLNASNNAGDRPYHWALDDDMQSFLEENGADTDKGSVLVPDHVPKVKEFFSKDCWAHHPAPHADFIAFKEKERSDWEAEQNKLIPGML